MKRTLHAAFMLLLLSALMTGCGIFKSGKKEGCPSNGKNVGAERLLSGEKVPRVKKFKS